MIVKVQLSFTTHEGKRRVLVYNKRRTVEFEGDETSEIVEALAGEHKAFFHAELIDGLIHIGEKATWQNW